MPPRMPDARLPNKAFYGELQVGKHSQCGQKKRYKDTLKASLKNFSIPPESWEETAPIKVVLPHQKGRRRLRSQKSLRS